MCTDTELSQPWTVLDLPSLHTRPSATVLLDVLNVLAVKPPTFDGAGHGEEVHQSKSKADGGIPRYLTAIISNQLGWIEDEVLREKIWETAGARLSERSGRTGMLLCIPNHLNVLRIVLTQSSAPAMPSVHRTFSIPVYRRSWVSQVSITLLEPSLTGDNLGHKTWAASYMLAKRLLLFRDSLPIFSDYRLQQGKPARVLELGAGTGLVGIAAAAIFATHVDLTDLPEICANLAHNTEKNESMVRECGGSMAVFPLDWSDLPPKEEVSAEDKYDAILAADSLYSPQHPAMLTDAISRYLRPHATSRVVVELPRREAYQPEVNEFKRMMKEKGLALDDQGEETGYDDWEDGSKEVRCWWAVWSWERTSKESTDPKP